MRTVPLQLRFTRRFSMAHRLIAGPSTKCATPHGHNEFVVVHLAPTGSARLDGAANMVVEFGQAKKRWHAFVDDHRDHALQLSDADPLLELSATHFPGWRIVVTPGDPTTELMAALLMSKCQAILDAEQVPLTCVRLELEETPTNSVVFEGDPQAVIPSGTSLSPWWTRGDPSTR